MLKLFKYNWLRNSTIYYATMTVLLLFQTALIITENFGGIMEEWTLVLSVLGFTIGGFILFTHICFTYNNNLKSYSRRLLPVAPIKEIGALLLLQIIYVVIMAAIIAVVYAILLPMISVINMDFIHTFLDRPSLMISGLIYTIWAAVSILVFIMLGIAIAACFKTKNRVWIGITAFIIITGFTAYISNLLFGDGMARSHESNIIGDGFSISIADMNFGGFAGEIAFDVVTMLLAIFVMTYLMNKKIEL